MGEAAGIFTLKAQLISFLGIILVLTNSARELSDSFVLSDLERGGTFSRRISTNF